MNKKSNLLRKIEVLLISSVWNLIICIFFTTINRFGKRTFRLPHAIRTVWKWRSSHMFLNLNSNSGINMLALCRVVQKPIPVSQLAYREAQNKPWVYNERFNKFFCLGITSHKTIPRVAFFAFGPALNPKVSRARYCRWCNVALILNPCSSGGLADTELRIRPVLPDFPWNTLHHSTLSDCDKPL